MAFLPQEETERLLASAQIIAKHAIGLVELDGVAVTPAKRFGGIVVRPANAPPATPAAVLVLDEGELIEFGRMMIAMGKSVETENVRRRSGEPG
jgi:hypothetical protein